MTERKPVFKPQQKRQPVFDDRPLPSNTPDDLQIAAGKVFVTPDEPQLDDDIKPGDLWYDPYTDATHIRMLGTDHWWIVMPLKDGQQVYENLVAGASFNFSIGYQIHGTEKVNFEATAIANPIGFPDTTSNLHNVWGGI